MIDLISFEHEQENEIGPMLLLLHNCVQKYNFHNLKPSDLQGLFVHLGRPSIHSIFLLTIIKSGNFSGVRLLLLLRYSCIFVFMLSTESPSKAKITLNGTCFINLSKLSTKGLGLMFFNEGIDDKLLMHSINALLVNFVLTEIAA